MRGSVQPVASPGIRGAIPWPVSAFGPDDFGKGAAANPRVVYFVDDDAALRRSASLLLGAEGFAVRTFASAEALLADCADACGADTSGILVLDLGLPGLDGIALLAALRARASVLPALLVTASAIEARPGLKFRLREAGFVDVLEKPFPPGHLVKAVRAAFRH